MAKANGGLKRGDAIVIKDRLWAIVNEKGRLAWVEPDVSVFDRRDSAVSLLRDSQEENWSGSEGWRVVRLNDVTGTVV